jgi:hypothetical protein
MFLLKRCIEGPVGDLAIRQGADAATVVWLVCFSSSISWRHVLHACIVFGGRWSTMASDMIGTYRGYVIGIVFSTLLRYTLSKTAVLTGDVAFFTVLFSTSIVNYVVLRAIAARRQSAQGKDE